MTVPVAVVGCGGVSGMHLDGCQRHTDQVRVVAACDLDPDRVAQACEKYRIPKGFATVEEMIAGANWEAAIVCTPPSVREEVIATLAAAGKHILVEKPMASSLEEARRMVERCGIARVQLSVDQNFRYHYAFHLAKACIAEGRIGNVVSLLHTDLMFRQDRGWRLQEERHAMMVMGVHWLDGFRWILGSEAHTLSCLTRSAGSIECAGETDATVQIAFENGTIATYIQSFACARPQTETTVIGEKGALVIRYSGMDLYDRSGAAQPVEHWPNPYFGQRGEEKPDSAFANLGDLLRAVAEKREPSNSGRDNLKTISLLEAAYQSATEGGRVLSFQEGLLA